VGHNSRTCTKKAGKRKSKQKTPKAKQETSGRKCGNCGKVGTGHNSRTCPKAAKGEVSPPKSKKGKVSPPKSKGKKVSPPKGKKKAPKRPLQKPAVQQEVLASFPSQSSSDEFYEVRRGKDKVIYCTCPGWRKVKKRSGCWHLDRVAALQAAALAALSS
jgi:hypothetical protein